DAVVLGPANLMGSLCRRDQDLARHGGRLSTPNPGRGALDERDPGSEAGGPESGLQAPRPGTPHHKIGHRPATPPGDQRLSHEKTLVRAQPPWLAQLDSLMSLVRWRMSTV